MAKIQIKFKTRFYSSHFMIITFLSAFAPFPIRLPFLYQQGLFGLRLQSGLPAQALPWPAKFATRHPAGLGASLPAGCAEFPPPPARVRPNTHIWSCTVAIPTLSLATMAHEQWMKRCLELAANGAGQVAPNPMVGCVIVYQNQAIAEGFHRAFGAPHAEPDAIGRVSNPQWLTDSTLYVNLEPCSHHGKTPPCADLIIASGIPRVVIGSRDPFPLVNGGGIEKLRSAGVEATVGVLENECLALNRRFFTFHQKNRPYVILKWARSCDNFMAPVSQQPGQISWISGQESQTLVHRWRSEEMAILIGSKTAAMDNPALTVRHVAGKNPLRMVIDSRREVKGNLTLLTDSEPLLVFNHHTNEERGNKHWIKLPFHRIHKEIADYLYQRNIQSVMVEGGSQTLQDFILNDMWDEARIITGPVHFGNGIPGPLLDQVPANTEIIGHDILHTFMA
jgi:diaminohydroxyphosphoribosylaminopyrimidine deaminase/5-amino-6-(5-phosphoribosylamino)uracil reductase